jgi:ribosomal protein S7
MSLRINTQKLIKLKKGRVPTLGSDFVGVLIKNGKKNKATKIFENALANACLELRKPLPFVLKTVVNRTSLFFEIKTLKRGKRMLTIPHFANRDRIRFLTVRNLIRDLREEKSFLNLTDRLTQEFIKIVMGRSSKTIEKNKQIVKEAVRHKSFLHHRW